MSMPNLDKKAAGKMFVVWEEKDEEYGHRPSYDTRSYLQTSYSESQVDNQMKMNNTKGADGWPFLDYDKENNKNRSSVADKSTNMQSIQSRQMSSTGGSPELLSFNNQCLL